MLSICGLDGTLTGAPGQYQLTQHGLTQHMLTLQLPSTVQAILAAWKE